MSPLRRRLLTTLGILAILAAFVVSDLPVHSSLREQARENATIAREINADLQPCTFAVRESFKLLGKEQTGSLSAGQRGRVPSLLREDQAACAFTDSNMYDLANIEVPGSAPGNQMGRLDYTVTLWATSDSVAAIRDMEAIFANPANTRAKRALAKEERLLRRDRATARQQLRTAERMLNARLPQLHLPVTPAARSS
jgi:hypothetical protein